jgi:pimeloyl-ACP methyl ester carboxylesterase
MKNWPQGTVHPTDEVSLRYFRSGGDKPPLVLVHGFTDSALYFERLADLLAESWDVIAYDARGHGQSSRITDRFDDTLRADDLQFVINELSLDRPALLGHSMGAATIALAATRNPELSRGIVLEDPAWWEPAEASSPDEASTQRAERQARNQAWREWVAALQTMPFEQALAERAATRTFRSLSERKIAVAINSRTTPLPHPCRNWRSRARRNHYDRTRR